MHNRDLEPLVYSETTRSDLYTSRGERERERDVREAYHEAERLGAPCGRIDA